MKTNKLLVFEEKKRELTNLLFYLNENGFDVSKVSSESDLFSNLLETDPDLILLSAGSQVVNSIKYCRELKSSNESKDIFVVLIGYPKEEEIHIMGLEAGADDFISYKLTERLILRRLNAILKRKKRSQIKFSDQELIMDEERFKIIYRGLEFDLPRKEFQILSLLNSNRGKIFTREEIKNGLWNDQNKVKARTVDVHIRKIRERIGSEVISTINGIGYRVEIE